MTDKTVHGDDDASFEGPDIETPTGDGPDIHTDTKTDTDAATDPDGEEKPGGLGKDGTIPPAPDGVAAGHTGETSTFEPEEG